MTDFILVAAAGGAADIVKGIADTFGVDWSHLIAQIISFTIVAILLHKFAYKKVLGVLEARRQRITEGLKNAERIKAELTRTEAARQEVLTPQDQQRLAEETTRELAA